MPGSEAAILVRREEAETYIVKATSTENDGNRLIVAKRIVKNLLH